MIITIEVKKDDAAESNLGLLKRFNRRLQGAGIIRRAKSLQYKERTLSAYKQKQKALRRITKVEKIARLRKLGKIPDAGYKKSD